MCLFDGGARARPFVYVSGWWSGPIKAPDKKRGCLWRVALGSTRLESAFKLYGGWGVEEKGGEEEEEAFLSQADGPRVVTLLPMTG